MTSWTVAHQAPLFMGMLQARILEWVAMPSSRGSYPPRSFTLQVDSLPSEPPVKPKNTTVGSLCLLWGIFSTQELNQGLLHCRQVLYQLSYQGIPKLPQFSPQPGPEHHPLYLGSYSSLLTGPPVSLLL